MPFKSKAQMDFCYARKYKAEVQGLHYEWDCDEFIRETNIYCLPKKVGDPMPKGCKNHNNNKITKELLVGPKGGKYMVIKINGRRKRKIHIPRSSKLKDLDYDKVTYLEPKTKYKRKSSCKQKNISSPKMSLKAPRRVSIQKKSPKRARKLRNIKRSGRKKFARKMSPRKRRMQEEEIHTGPRGGIFYYRNGKKVYLTSVPDY